jgi:cobalt-zinc-cadmium efflux system protein
MATLHLQLAPLAEQERAMQFVRETLQQRFDIRHVTVQIDAEDCPDGDRACGGGGVH